MAPNSVTVTESPPSVPEVAVSKAPPIRLAWRNIISLSILHLLTVYALYRAFTGKCKVSTVIVSYIIGFFGALGITAGSHRLWSHRTYKAKMPLRIFLMLMNCLSFQGDIHEWSRDHRVHHKHSDSDGDPYNASRGFFFSHMGWVMVRKHPDVTAKGKAIDCSDILADPVVRFQMKVYKPLSTFMCFVLPTCLNVWLVNETWWNSFILVGVSRYCISLHMTWLVNSAAHMWGYRPYDKHIAPRENIFVTLAVHGEGFHNYHHTFPWDYSTSEFGIKWNLTTAFINLMAMIGQAYDLRTATPEMVKKRRMRTGDISHSY